jgi:hypothetical protein
MFSATVRLLSRLSSWYTMPMPSFALSGAGDPDLLAVHENLPLVGRIVAVEDLHQGGLARAVLADDRMDLPA